MNVQTVDYRSPTAGELLPPVLAPDTLEYLDRAFALGVEILDWLQGNWLDINGNRGELIINAGDMLCEATGGYFPSTTHRVIKPSADTDNVSRDAIPYFMAPRLDTVLSDRYTAGSYLSERLQALSRQ